MRIGYLDCSSGASGDMLLGALLGAGWEEAALRDVAEGLGAAVRIAVSRVHRRGVPAFRVEVFEDGSPDSRPYPVLARLLAQSRTDDSLRRAAGAVLHRLAGSEAEVHATSIEDVHLHELGGLDTLVDIVGVIAGFRALGLDRLVASPVNLGRGWIDTQHGTVPVPAPATAELARGMPVYAGENEGELLTPTGAVLLSTLVSGWDILPPMRLERIGIGAGRADPPQANVLRLFLGDALEDGAETGRDAETGTMGVDAYATERLVMLETSIDDMSGQLFPHVTARLHEAGALDVTTVPALMKKGRPGHLLRVLARPDHVRALCGILFAETTTLGIRSHEVTRLAVERREAEVDTEFGPVPVKIAGGASGIVNISPEFEACRALAARHGVPVKRVMAAAQRAAAALEDKAPSR